MTVATTQLNIVSSSSWIVYLERYKYQLKSCLSSNNVGMLRRRQSLVLALQEYKPVAAFHQIAFNILIVKSYLFNL